MSEQKSLPRRGRSRYHHQQYQFSTNTTPRHHNSSKNNNMNTTSANNSTKILSPRGAGVGGGGGGGVSISGSGSGGGGGCSGGGNLKSISSTFKSQDSIQCHIPTLVKSPSVTQQQHQQQLQKHQLQLQQQQQQLQQKTNSVTTNATTNSSLINNTNVSSCSSSNIATSNKLNKISHQQPLLITPKLAHHHPQQHHNLISAPLPPSQLNQPDTTTDLLDNSCNNPIASLGPVTCMPSSQFRPIPHKTVPASVGSGHANGGGEGVGTILNPSTAPLSSKFFSATTLPK